MSIFFSVTVKNFIVSPLVRMTNEILSSEELYF